ncbi:MAG: DUF4870 domain-containing protein [Verrucomicrobiales bacterium]|nr:DUF4870 domain-containing protein [Verrucomicrobiales bacterium]
MKNETTNDEAVTSSPPALITEVSPGRAEKNWAVGAHLASVAGWVGIPLGHILAPFVVWLIKKDESEFVRGQAIESLNFQISMTIYAFIAGILAVTIIGLIVAIPAIIVIAIGDIIYTFIGAMRVSEGEPYRYPLTIRLFS